MGCNFPNYLISHFSISPHYYFFFSGIWQLKSFLEHNFSQLLNKIHLFHESGPLSCLERPPAHSSSHLLEFCNKTAPSTHIQLSGIQRDSAFSCPIALILISSLQFKYYHQRSKKGKWEKMCIQLTPLRIELFDFKQVTSLRPQVPSSVKQGREGTHAWAWLRGWHTEAPVTC